MKLGRTPEKRSARQFHGLRRPCPVGEFLWSVREKHHTVPQSCRPLVVSVITIQIHGVHRTPLAASSSAAQRVNWSTPALDTVGEHAGKAQYWNARDIHNIAAAFDQRWQRFCMRKKTAARLILSMVVPGIESGAFNGTEEICPAAFTRMSIRQMFYRPRHADFASSPRESGPETQIRDTKCTDRFSSLINAVSSSPTAACLRRLPPKRQSGRLPMLM